MREGRNEEEREDITEEVCVRKRSNRKKKLDQQQQLG